MFILISSNNISCHDCRGRNNVQLLDSLILAFNAEQDSSLEASEGLDLEGCSFLFEKHPVTWELS